jgi:hypothetical protein
MAIRHRLLTRQLEAYEEGWQKDHADAMRCRDFEEFLAVGVAVFRALAQVDAARRQRIARGLEEPSPEDDRELLDHFRRWLATARLVREELRSLEDQFEAVDGSAEFCRCVKEAREIVAEWVPAIAPEAGPEQVVAHTERPQSGAEMAQALDRVSRPAPQESGPLPFNPDDDPLF